MTNRQMDALVVGSVVRRGDSYRVVRAITRYPASPGAVYPPKLFVTFAIKRRSWTNRAYTVYNRSDLRTLAYVPTPAVLRLRSRRDRALAADIRDKTRRHHLTPEDVRGMP